MLTMLQLEFESILNEIQRAPEPKVEQMELEIDEEATRIWIKSCLVDSHIWNPQPSIVFNDGHKPVGSLTWKDGIFKFDGEVETSGKLFFNYLSSTFGLKIKA